jgi:hypothetical protein
LLKVNILTVLPAPTAPPTADAGCVFAPPQEAVVAIGINAPSRVCGSLFFKYMPILSPQPICMTEML